MQDNETVTEWLNVLDATETERLFELYVMDCRNQKVEPKLDEFIDWLNEEYVNVK